MRQNTWESTLLHNVGSRHMTAGYQAKGFRCNQTIICACFFLVKIMTNFVCVCVKGFRAVHALSMWFLQHQRSPLLALVCISITHGFSPLQATSTGQHKQKRPSHLLANIVVFNTMMHRCNDLYRLVQLLQCWNCNVCLSNWSQCSSLYSLLP